MPIRTTAAQECDEERRDAVSMRVGLYQWCVPPVAMGEQTAVRVDQYDESIRVLNAHRVVEAAGDLQARILVG
jgi:hypothetical protein